jgi:hypothetical protein
MQAPLGIQLISERQQIVLAGAASVVEDQQAGRSAGRWTLTEDEDAHIGRLVGGSIQRSIMHVM